VKIKAGGAQPLDRYIFERVPDAKDPQRPAGKSRAFVLCGLGIFKLQRPLAGVTKARSAKVLSWRRRGLARHKGRVDRGVDVI
jgi:hypothetical protein